MARIVIDQTSIKNIDLFNSSFMRQFNGYLYIFLLVGDFLYPHFLALCIDMELKIIVEVLPDRVFLKTRIITLQKYWISS